MRAQRYHTHFEPAAVKAHATTFWLGPGSLLELDENRHLIFQTLL